MQKIKNVKDPRKQRKKQFNAPAHIRHKLMAAHLAPELVKSRGAKSLPVRKGDTVRVVRGDRKGFEGKISRIDLKNFRVYIEGLTREKVDGTTIFISLHPSKVMIKNLSLNDKWRKNIVERKQSQITKEEKVIAQRPAETKKAKTETSADVTETKEEESKLKSEKKMETSTKATKKKTAESKKPNSETRKVRPGKKTATQRKSTKKGDE